MSGRYKAEDYSYRVFWSDEDKAWVGVCDEFKGLSYISEDNQCDAFLGIVDLIDGMHKCGEEPPAPLSTPGIPGPDCCPKSAQGRACRPCAPPR